jgi:hypothetical protein
MAMAKRAQRATHEDYPHHLNGYGCVTMKQHMNFLGYGKMNTPIEWLG